MIVQSFNWITRMDAMNANTTTSSSAPLIFFLERQWRPRAKFEGTRLAMTRASAIERYRFCVARARGEWNRTTHAMRLTDASGAVVVDDDGAECKADLGEERRAAAAKKLERMGGLEGMLDRELRKTMGGGGGASELGGLIDVYG